MLRKRNGGIDRSMLMKVLRKSNQKELKKKEILLIF